MAETVETAVYRLRVEGQDQIDRMTKSIEGLAVAEEDATKATRTTSDELQKRLARYDPVIRAQQAYTKELEQIARFQESGIGTQQQINALSEGATSRYQAAKTAVTNLGNAHAGMNGQAQAAMHAMRGFFESVAMGAPITQALTQHLSQLSYAASGEGGLLGAFKQVGSMIAGMISPITLVTGGVMALGAAALYAANQFDKLQVSSQRAISGTGTRTGTTVEDINKFVAQTSSGRGGAGLSDTDARKLAEGFTKSGEIVVSQLHDMGTAVMGFANQTEKSVDDAIKAFVEFGKDPVKALQAFTEAFGPLNDAQQKALESALSFGDKTAALNVILDAHSEALKKAAENMGFMEKMGRLFITTIWGGEIQKPIGIDTQIANAKKQLDALIASAANMPPGLGGAMLAEDIKKATDALIKLQEQKEKTNMATLAAQMADVAAKAREATESIIPQIKQIDQLTIKINVLQAALGGAGTSAALTAAQNQLQALKEAQEEAARYNDRVKAISQAWGEVGQVVALQLQTLQNNLQVLEAVGGAARMAAQYAADYANAIDKGKTAIEAAALAAANLAAAQAQVNSAAKETLWNLENQAAAARAVTDEQKRLAEATATQNKLIHDGVDELLAQQVATQQLANAEATAAASKKRSDDAAADRTKENQYSESRNYAGFKMQIDDVASSTQRAAGTVSLLANNTAQAAAEAQQLEAQWDQTALAAQKAATAAALSYKYSMTLTGDPTLDSIAYRTKTWSTEEWGTPTGVSASTLPIQEQMFLAQNPDWKWESAGPGDVGHLVGPQEAAATKTDDLKSSIDDLKTSTDDLRKSNEDLLSPYYTQDPRTSHIGFRSQGMASGGYVDVPGGYSANDNMLATVPVASGERIYVDPMTGRRGSAGGSLTINISSPVLINGNANKDDVGRTMFQNNQNLSKQLRAAMQ